MPLADFEIAQLALEHKMITPFTERVDTPISYGLTSFGYDIQLADVFKFPMGRKETILDPLSHDKYIWNDARAEKHILIPPKGFVLGCSVEAFRMPDDVCAVCVGRSTYARVGLFVNVTPLEPGWEGTLTMELSNLTQFTLKVYVGMGIAQLQFFRGERPMTTYAERKGKYMGQTGVTPARGG